MAVAVQNPIGRRVSYAPAAPGLPQLPQAQPSTYSSLAPPPAATGGTATTQTQTGTTPGPYPSALPTFFQPRQAPPVLGSPPLDPRDVAAYERQRLLAGPLASILPTSPQRPLRTSDIPLFEAGLNFEQLLQAERDREFGYGELVRGRAAIGSDPAAMAARNLALERSQAGGGPFDQGLIEQTLGTIRNRGAVGLEESQRGATEELARRGLGGGLLASQLARLQRDTAGDIQRQSTDFQTQARLANDEAQRMALSQLSEITGREEMQRGAMDQLLSQIFTETQRQPISLAGLVPQTKQQAKRIRAKYSI